MRTVDLECQFLESSSSLPILTSFCLFSDNCSRAGVTFLPVLSGQIVCLEKLTEDRFLMLGALQFSRGDAGNWIVEQMVIDPSVKSRGLAFRIANLLLDKVIERREANRTSFGDSAIIFKIPKPQSYITDWLADMLEDGIVVNWMFANSYSYHGHQISPIDDLIKLRQVLC